MGFYCVDVGQCVHVNERSLAIQLDDAIATAVVATASFLRPSLGTRKFTFIFIIFNVMCFSVSEWLEVYIR